MVKHTEASVRLRLDPSSGALLLEMSRGKNECFLFQDFHSSDVEKLKPFFAGMSRAKYIGGSDILACLKRSPELSGRFEREIVVDAGVDALFFPEEGIVRIRKEQIQQRPVAQRPARKKKVLIIDDSKTIQKLLSKIISGSKELEVMAVADRPSAAREIIEKERPDLITLDIHMPEMNGVEFLKTYLKRFGIPVVMVSSVSMEEGPLVMDALGNGALTYIQKPSLEKMAQVAPEILEQLETISKDKVEELVERKARVKTYGGFQQTDGLIAIGSSTGGTKALQEILTSLPSSIPPIVVVQHIPAVFSKALAERLDGLCPFTVKEAQDGDVIEKNTVYIAPGGLQMKITKRSGIKKIVLTDDEPVNRFKPSVDYLFDSIPLLGEKDVLAAVLTGMGKDGAQGLLKLKNAGAYTIAQDESSCVVFGMPKEAIRLGAAKKVVHLTDMSDTFVEEFNALKRNKSA